VDFDPGAAAHPSKLIGVNAASTFSSNVVVFLLADIKPTSRWWGYGRYVLSRFSLSTIEGLQFFKMLGSGYEGGFGLRPSGTKQGLFCVFDSLARADDFLANAPLVAKYRHHSREFLSVKLLPFSVKGTWAGQGLGVAAKAPENQWVAALTRASIRPSKAKRFWSKQPASERSLRSAKGCLLASGVGEAPFFRQATFTVWENVAAMDAYARTGAHLEAIKASMNGAFFSETMFVRFALEDLRGTYNGKVYG
jgi:hypothetical protein